MAGLRQWELLAVAARERRAAGVAGGRPEPLVGRLGALLAPARFRLRVARPAPAADAPIVVALATPVDAP